MSSCQQEIIDGLASGAAASWVDIHPATQFNISFSDVVKHKMRISINNQETVKFTFAFSGPQLRFTIAFFDITNADAIVPIGLVSSVEHTTVFQKDFSPGDYVLCFSTLIGEAVGDISAEYSGYVPEIRFPGKAYTGSHALATLSTFFPVKVCNEMKKFWCSSGSTPPGLTLREDGVIDGFIPELDEMIDEAGEYPPSINLFYQDADGNWRPIGRRWTFKAVVQLVNFPSRWTEETFHIDVLNDWSLDRDAFMLHADDGFLLTNSVEVVDDPTQIKIDAPVCCTYEQNTREISPIEVTIEMTSADTKPIPTNNSPFVESFLKKLEESNISVETPINTSSNEGTNLRSPSDVDYQFLKMGNELKVMYMPMLFLGQTGEEMHVNITLSYESTYNL